MLMTVIRTALLYLVVIICMRIMGKRQVGELQPSEFVVTILISELASIPIQDLSHPVSSGIIAILVLVFLELLLSAVVLKSRFFRRIFEGKPAIIVQNGIVDQKMMKKLRITIDDLLEGIRQTGNFSLDTVDFAVMETNGKLSVQPKIMYEPVSKKDMKISAKDQGFPTVVISDGKLITEAFSSFTTISKKDVKKQLEKKSLSVEDVFLMTVDKTGTFVTIRKERN